MADIDQQIIEAQVKIDEYDLKMRQAILTLRIEDARSHLREKDRATRRLNRLLKKASSD